MGGGTALGGGGGSSGTGGGSATGGSTGTGGGSAGGSGGGPASCARWNVVNGGVAGPGMDPGTCQKPIKTSALPASQVQALGVHPVGEVVQFDVAQGTGTISIVSQASTGVVDTIKLQGIPMPNTVVPTALKNPSGVMVYDDEDAGIADPASADVYYFGLSPVTGTMTLPNTTKALSASAAGYPAGKWSFTVNDWALECSKQTKGCKGGTDAGTYDITVLTKPIAPTTGTVDLAFYFVTNKITATAAMTDPSVQRFLSTLAIIYGRAGLCLGAITFYDVPTWARNKWATGVDATKTGPCDGLDQLFTLSQPGNTLNFFLVDDISQGSTTSGGQIVGIDGAIPGPSSVGGTVHSGAVVNFANYAAGTANCTGAPAYLKCGADMTAYITAHEGGHWMGLYHATEGIGVMYDPLTDTPQCTCSAACGVTKPDCCFDATKGLPLKCLGKPVYLTGANCSMNTATCGGADLLMFWSLDTTAAGNFSAQQAAVVRANPVVR
jgi:hypothetical protein